MSKEDEEEGSISERKQTIDGQKEAQLLPHNRNMFQS